MKKVLASMSKYVFALFALAVLALLMSLTYGALQKLFPGSFANQVWGLVMFDVAAICWALAFVFESKSVGQYAAAGIGFIVAFVGTLGMVAAEVMLSGQDLAQIDTGEIGKWMVYGFIVVTAIHAALVYAHHATAPEIHEQINVGIARGEIVTEAISQATHTLDAEKASLAQTITADIVSQVKRDLGLAPIQDTVFDRRRTYQQTALAPWPPDSNPYWKCHGCAAFNQTDHTRCEMCGAERGTWRLNEEGKPERVPPTPRPADNLFPMPPHEEDTPATGSPFPGE